MVDVVGVVIHHVEDNTYASLVESLYHLFKLTNTGLGVIRVRRVRTLGNVIVHGVVAPVVLIVLQTSLVNRAEVVTGQYMDSVDTETL